MPIAASPAFVFPDGLLSIGPSAFESCGELTVVSIPSSVNSIGTATFAACNKLTAINVAEANANYSSSDGVLYNEDKSTLIQYPAGKASSPYTVESS